MRIVHVLAYFKEDVAYQENYLTVGQRELGHEVFIITSQLEFNFGVNHDDRMHPLGKTDYKGVTIIRTKILFEMKNKFVIFRNLYKYLEMIKPDVIFFHDHSPELLTCVRYVKKHPGTRLRVDVHSSIENSMHSLFGKPYHKIFWKGIIKHIQKYYDKVFGVAPECIEFAEKIYGISPDKIELLPLPGDASLLNDYENNRKAVRDELKIAEDEIAIFHTGKLPQQKKTKEVLEAFSELNLPKVKLYIFGYISEEFRPFLDHYLKINPNIIFKGWVTADKLKRYLIGADMLLQPGGLSNTYIEAICCGVPLVLANCKQGRELCKMGNGYLIECSDKEGIMQAIQKVATHEMISLLREKTFLASKEYHYVEVARKSLA